MQHTAAEFRSGGLFMIHSWFDRYKRYILCCLIILVWQLLSAEGLLPYRSVPSPVEVIRGIMALLSDGLPLGNTLTYHMLYSLIRVLCGFMLACFCAVPLGILLGWSRPLREALTPVIEIIRPIPPLAWIPLAILWFGIGLRSASFIIFLGCFFPILLNTVSGVTSVDRLLVEAAKTLGARERDIFIKILIPGATPSIYTGLRIGLGIGWMTLVAAEFTGVKSGYGLGYMIMTARDIQRPDLVIAGMVVIGLTGFILDAVVRLCEARSLRWRGADS